MMQPYGEESQKLEALQEHSSRQPAQKDPRPLFFNVERHNLTVRTFMKRFTRLALGFSKKLECLEAATALFLAYYNFVWRSRYPDHSGQRGRRRPPAAMAAGIVNKLWRFEDFFDALYQMA